MDDSSTLRVPPHSIEAEQSVIGGVLLDNAALPEVAGIVQPGDFYRPAHRVIFEAMLTLAGAGEPVDVVTLSEALRGQEEKTGGPAYLAELSESTPAACNAGAYARIVAEYASRRELLRAAGDLAEAAHTGEGIEAAQAAIRIRKVAALSALPLRTLAELREEPEADVSWLVDGLLPVDGLSLLIAPPKAGKSTLIRTLAAVVSNGGAKWLRRGVMAHGPVVHLALEERRKTVEDHYRMLEASDDAIHLHIGPLAAPPRSRLAMLREAIHALRPALVIVDPLFRFVRVDDDRATSDGGYSRLTLALEPLLSLARDERTHIALVHHSRKGGGDHGEEALGSTALAASVDSILSLSRDNGRRTLYAFGRDGVDLEKTFLAFDNGHIRAGESKRAADQRELGARILEHVGAQDVALSGPQIREAVGGRTASVTAATRLLVEDGDLVTVGSGNRIRYALPASASASPTI